MSKKLNRNIVRYLSVFIMFMLLLMSAFFTHYVNKISFYGDFNLEVTNNKGENITELIDVYGVTYFDDTIKIYSENNFFLNCKKCYFTEILLQSNYILNDTIFVRLEQDQISQDYILDTVDKFHFHSLRNNSESGFLSKIISIRIFFLFALIILSLIVLIFISIIYSSSLLKILNKDNNRLFRKSITISFIVFCLISGFFFFKWFYHHDEPTEILSQISYEKVHSKKFDLDTVGNAYQIVIEDTSGKGIEFVFSLNGKFWFNIDSVMSFTREQFSSEEMNLNSEMLSVLNFVSTYSYHRYPEQELVENDLLNNPYIILNSTGYGICSNRSIMLCAILDRMGYLTRIVNVEGYHTFIEAFNGEKWILLDPDYGLALESLGELISLEQFQEDSLGFPVIESDNQFFCNVENLVKAFPERLKQIYFKDSLISYLNYRSIENEDLYFCLPSGTRIIFPVYDSISDRYLMKIKIFGHYKGNLRVPLLISSIENNSNKKTEQLLNEMSLFNSFDVEGDDIEIYALVNPLLFSSNYSMNEFEFSYYSKNGSIPLIDIIERNSSNDVFLESKSLVNLIKKEESEYLKIASNCLDNNGGVINGWNGFVILLKKYGIFNENEMLVKNMILQNDIDESEFLAWLEKPENLAIILIILDNPDKKDNLVTFGKYIKMLKNFRSV